VSFGRATIDVEETARRGPPKTNVGSVVYFVPLERGPLEAIDKKAPMLDRRRSKLAETSAPRMQSD